MADAVTISRPSTGGGSGNWTDDIEEATLDGDIALEKQASAPSATSDYAKVYSKEVSGTAELFAMDGAGTETQLT
jgi:hypothetical protein